MQKITSCFYLALTLICSAEIRAQEYHPGHLFVKMKNSSPLKESIYMKSSKELLPDLYLIKTDDLEKLEADTAQWDVEYIEKDHFHHHGPLPKLEEDLTLTPQLLSQSLKMGAFNDEKVHRLWAFDDTWGMSVTRTYGELPPWSPQEIIVAVIDTGVDYHHEDLKNVMWKNPFEIPGDGIDNDGNGYVDDVHGINTLVRTSSGEATGNPMASHWHGTHVAGTIAAEMNNEIGIAGVAHNVKIMAIRAIPDNSHESDVNIIESLLYAARNGAKIINCSFSKPSNNSRVTEEVISRIGRDYGVLVIAASGNNSKGPFRWFDIDSKPQTPASLTNSNLLTVASTNNKGKLSFFSNIGRKSVDLAAPGDKIYSTVKRNRYSSSSGTSMAAPNASGVAAMVLGYFPDLTPEQLKDALMKSVKYSPYLEGKIKAPGIINLHEALRILQD